MSSWKYLCFQEYINHRSDGKQAYFLKNNVRKKKISKKKEWKKRAAHIFALLKKNECHSHFAPFDKKEWHSSFAPYFGSGAQEWRSKECRSLTHWIKLTENYAKIAEVEWTLAGIFWIILMPSTFPTQFWTWEVEIRKKNPTNYLLK